MPISIANPNVFSHEGLDIICSIGDTISILRRFFYSFTSRDALSCSSELVLKSGI